MDLTDCYDKRLIKKTKIDRGLIKSLIEMANIKERVVKTSSLDEENISVFVSLAYDALREILEAICISKGYKVLSHICMGELLKDILKSFDYNEFDRVRYIRNGINYYGIKVDFEEGKGIISKIFKIKEKMLKGYLIEGKQLKES